MPLNSEGLEVVGYLFRLRYGPGHWSPQRMFSETLPNDDDAKEIVPLVTLSQASSVIAGMREALEEVILSLEWMIENDETNEGDTPLPDHGGKTWNEINKYWIDGLNRSRDAVSQAKPLMTSVKDKS